MPFQLPLKDDCPEFIAQRAKDVLHVVSDFYELYSEDIQEAAKAMSLCLAGQQRVLVAGLDVSGHIARTLAGRLLGSGAGTRVPLPALALSCSLPAGDGDPADVLARQVLALGSDGDILALISHDGSHQALVRAAQAAREQNMFVLGLTGGDGGALAQMDLLDLELRVPSIEEALVHETHMGLVLLLDDLIGYYLTVKPEIIRETLQSGLSRLTDDLGGEEE